MTDLKNQCRYFEVDMSENGMAKLTSNRSETRQEAKALFQSADELTRSTKNYIQSVK